ncbi:MAG: hypothetical protein ACP5I8_03805 [Phycisphaerae bacterium]
MRQPDEKRNGMLLQVLLRPPRGTVALGAGILPDSEFLRCHNPASAPPGPSHHAVECGVVFFISSAYDNTL